MAGNYSLVSFHFLLRVEVNRRWGVRTASGLSWTWHSLSPAWAFLELHASCVHLIPSFFFDQLPLCVNCYHHLRQLPISTITADVFSPSGILCIVGEYWISQLNRHLRCSRHVPDKPDDNCLWPKGLWEALDSSVPGVILKLLVFSWLPITGRSDWLASANIQ